MYVESLRCVGCGSTYSPENIVYVCKDCGSSLDVVYNYDQIQDIIDWKTLKSRGFSHFRYHEFLPLVSKENVVSLGEGGTPLIKSEGLSGMFDFDLYFKLESYNPTGSFKDRGTSTELGRALDFGVDEIAVASTGNMGASIAAYCARADVTVKVFVPVDVSGPKVDQIREHGAEIIRVDGDYNLAAERAWDEYEKKEKYLMGDYPYRGEGEKTVGFELAEQITADKVVVPVGNGTLLHGIWKGYNEFDRVDLIDDKPELLGVQAEGCNTIVNPLR